jgi:uncharacterized protein YdaU (DUF1376 family)
VSHAEPLVFYPVYLADNALALSRLSRPDGVCAYHLLWQEYHYSRGLPDDNEKVRRIAGMTGNKKWDRVCAELHDAGFTKSTASERGWRNPKWDKSIATAEAAHAGRVRGGVEKARRSRLTMTAEEYEDNVPF